MLIYCTLEMHVQQATYANELHVNVQHLLFSSRTVYSLLLHLDHREKIASPKQDLFCSRKPLTYPGSASVQCGLHGRTEYPLSQALTFFT